ncbi:MAG: hypothetical protein WCK90_01040 [archaeon]
MLWSKKEDKTGLPDLPPLPAKISLDKESSSKPQMIMSEETHEDDEEFSETERHNLPSFPDSPIEKGFSQSAIKDAVKTPMVKEIPEPPMQKSFKIVEEEEWTPKKPTTIEEEDMPISSMSKKGDIFVKIDKFYSAKKAINTAKNKLEEIDDLLKKIRDTKMREDQELTSWEKEVTALKTKLQDVNSNLFEKAE